MKNIIISTVCTALCFSAAAQKPEAVTAKSKKATDTVKLVTGYYVPDSLHTEIFIEGKNKRIMPTVVINPAKPKKNTDTVKLVTGYYVPDSLHSETPVAGKKKTITTTTTVTIDPGKPKKVNPVMYKTEKGILLVSDSAYKVKSRLFTRADSQYRKANVFEIYNDTARRNKSLFTLRTTELRNDSLHTVLYANKVALSKKLYQQNLKADSLKLMKYLEQKKTIMLRLAVDSVQIKSGYRMKKLYIDMPCTETDTIFIKNSYRKVRVFVNGNSKVSATTTIALKDSINAPDEIIMNRIGISLSRNGKNITAFVTGMQPANLPGKDVYRDILQNALNLKNTVSIIVPANVVVVINTSNGEANVENYVQTFKTEIINGKLSMKNAGDATIKGNYSTITAGNIKNADVTMYASVITATSIDALKINSGSSTVKLKECITMDVMQSTGDAFILDKAVTVTGNKNFGKLTIDNLEGKLQLTGTGSSVAVNNFSHNIPQVAINSKYADVKLPLSTLPDYAVYYEGSFNDVNKTSAVTQQLNSLGKLSATLNLQKDSFSLNTKNQNIAKTILTANAGNTNGAHSKIDIVCPYCNVVFN